MKKITRPLIIAIFIIFFLKHGVSAQDWEKVASNGFGNPANDYAWSMATFQGKLYVGTLDTLKGGEIWRSGTGDPNSWEMVYRSRSSMFSNAGVRYLYNDANQALYASTMNSFGAEILRTTDGKNWSLVQKEIGRRWNTTIRSMIRFKDYLYAGAGSHGAQLYRSKNGFNWRLVKTSISSTRVYDPQRKRWVKNNLMIGELMVFNNQLYAFTWAKEARYQDILDHVFGYKGKKRAAKFSNPPGAFETWRSNDGINWEKVVGQNDAYGNGMGFCLHAPQNITNEVVTSTTVFKEQLYLGTQNANGKSSIWKTSDGEHWAEVLNFEELGESANYYIWRMIPYHDQLFVGVMNVGPAQNSGVTGAQVWVSESGDHGSFYSIVHNGFDGETWSNDTGLELPKNIGVRTFGILNDTLYAGTAVMPSILTPKAYGPPLLRNRRIIVGKNTGCEVWRLIQPDE